MLCVNRHTELDSAESSSIACTERPNRLLNDQTCTPCALHHDEKADHPEYAQEDKAGIPIDKAIVIFGRIDPRLKQHQYIASQ